MTKRVTLAQYAEQVYAFHPDQPRGPGGKWIHVGAAVEHAVHGKGTVTDTHAMGRVSVRFNRGGLKKVSGSSLSPSGHDPLGGEVDERMLDKSERRRAAMDEADVEGLHRAERRRAAAERANPRTKEIQGLLREIGSKSVRK